MYFSVCKFSVVVVVVLAIRDDILSLLSSDKYIPEFGMMKQTKNVMFLVVQGFNLVHRSRKSTLSNRLSYTFTRDKYSINSNYDCQKLWQHSCRCGGFSSTTTTGTSLFYYNNRQQHRGMSNEDELDKHATYKKKKDERMKQKQPHEWLPFWTTPIRDPHESIYIQDPIAEADCRPLRLYIPEEDDMLEVGTMAAMLFLTTPDLETYESLPNNGDVIFLKGDLGSGKTVFARGFIRGALGNWNIDVPSPTYLLSNTYYAKADQGSNKDLEYVVCSYFYIATFTDLRKHF
jgi:hypothetical protein